MIEKTITIKTMILPKFSIIIPTYKRLYLRECIESIISQTYINFELVIVNDASPEDIDSIVHSFNDSRIIYHTNKKNCGAENVVDNWNICLGYANGEYLICMGDDDKLLPNCLEEYVKLINKYPSLNLYHAWTEIIDEKSAFYSLQIPRPEYESVYSLLWNRWNNRYFQYIGDFLFKTKILKQNGGFYKLPLAWGSDDISALIAAKKAGVANTQKVIFQYRKNPNTISSLGNITLKLEAIQLEKEWCLNFLEEEPNNELDLKYYLLSKNILQSYFKQKCIHEISSNISQNSFLNIIPLLSKYKKYNLKFRTIVYIILEVIRKRQSNKTTI